MTNTKDTYYIFIDETGDFSFETNSSFIAGWVCKINNPNELKNIINKELEEFSNPDDQSKYFNFKKHMHYFPLLDRKYREKIKEDIPTDPVYAREIIDRVFKKIKNRIIFSFKSEGKLSYHIHKQHSYTEILRSILFQVLQDKEFKDAEKIKIFIASRRHKYLYGNFNSENFEEKIEFENYEKQYAIDRLNELKEALNKDLFNKIELKVEPISSSIYYEARFADILCGIIKDKDEDKLEHCKIKSYNINKSIKIIFNSDIANFREALKNDIVNGFVSGIHILSKNTDNSEIRQDLVETWKKLDSYQRRYINQIFENFFVEKLIESEKRYNNIFNVEQIINTLNVVLKEEFHKLENNEVKNLLLKIKKYSFICDTHKGVIDLFSYEACLDFMNKYANDIFPNIYLFLNERHNLILRASQIYINSFNFEKQKEEIENELNSYYKLIISEYKKDENLAKLEGTLGQIYALSAPFQKSEEEIENYYKIAEKYFLDDLEHCIEKSKAWYQCQGFLTTLYFKKKDYNNTLKHFCNELGVDKLEEDKLLTNLNSFRLYNIKNPDDFKLLHHLYVIALSITLNKKVTKFSAFVRQFLKTEFSKSEYPKCNIIKWISVIFYLTNDKSSSLEVLKQVKFLDDSEYNYKNFVKLLLHLIIKIIYHKIKLELEQDNNFDLEDELNKLDKINNGIKEKLITLGIKNYKNMSLFEVANLLPFNFS